MVEVWAILEAPASAAMTPSKGTGFGSQTRPIHCLEPNGSARRIRLWFSSLTIPTVSACSDSGLGFCSLQSPREALMKRQLCSLMLVASALVMLVAPCLAKNTANFKQKERTISLELEFTKKSSNPLQRAISFLNWGPNAYATGFLVGGRLVMTAYHVVSGELDTSKKMALGFGRNDKLDVKVYTNGCQARVLKVDPDADLALLEICTVGKQTSPAFQFTLNKDEKLMLVARPHGDRIISHGTFHGSYTLKGVDYWSVKISARDGFSGSPVYNEQGEVVGVFSGYDWSQKLAVVSPGIRAQKLLEEYVPSVKP
jgi:S1-C subfamily serine protease